MSDLRIAVAAGMWLRNSRAGDVLQIVTDDQAFDAVGDVAACCGVTFLRLSYRSLSGCYAEHAAAESPGAAGAAHDAGRPNARESAVAD